MSVLVYTENWDGKFKKQTYELVSYASEVAKMINTGVTVVSIGKVEETELVKPGNFGASKVINIGNDLLKVLDNQAYTNIIGEIAGNETLLSISCALYTTSASPNYCDEI